MNYQQYNTSSALFVNSDAGRRFLWSFDWFLMSSQAESISINMDELGQNLSRREKKLIQQNDICKV